MNFKNVITLVLIVGLLLISCKNSKKYSHESILTQKGIEQEFAINKNLLIGSWIDQSQVALHFSLFADGTAQSDNMATLLYQKWEVKDNQLYLVAKSIGNRSSSIDTMIFDIQNLDEKQMILKQGDLILEYKKADINIEKILIGEAESRSDQKSKIVSGKLRFGHEVRSFEPCGSDKSFWISDKSGELEKLYSKLIKNKKPYTPIFVEIEIIDKGKTKEGFPTDYKSVYEVIKILKTRELSDKDCQ